MACGAIAHCGERQIGIGCVKLRPGGMSIDVALSTRRGVGRDTYSLPKKKAATPRVTRQWVRPRSSAMSIDVALSTRGCIKIAPQNMLLILKARPRLSQVRALLYHKDFVSL